MADIERILIVGGGIAGLSAAAALHRQDLTAELIERSPTWPVIGAGINLPANGVRALRALGVTTAAEQFGAPIQRWGFFDQQGELLCQTDLEDLWRDVGPCLGFTRIRLHELLLQAAVAVPHRLGVALTELTQNDQRVRVTFSDGTSSDYDLVVGADGIHSTVRWLAVDRVSPSYAGTMAWRSVIPIRPAGSVDMMVLMGEGLFFGLVPMGEGHTYGFGAIGGERFEDPLAGRLERFRRRFADFAAPVPAYLSALQSDEQLHFGPIEWVELADWYRGRVVLIGDAAHAGPLHMGEGGCMAMEDALVLAEVLRTAEDLDAALAAYTARRQPRTNWVQEQSRAAAQAWVVPPTIRNAVFHERGDQILRDRYKPLISAP